MKYSQVVSGEFLSRLNRFIAKVKIDGVVEIVHVKNTGRCRELLVSGSRVILSKSDNTLRKTAYDLIAVEKVLPDGNILLINMDSQIPNDAVGEWLRESGLFSSLAQIRREVRFGNSRFDFYIEDGNRKAFLEVKGVTLEKDGVALFPDAPTERGVKHLDELAECVDCGYEAYVVFVIQMNGVRCFKPNDTTHKAFGEALRRVSQSGVKILAYDCIVGADFLKINSPIAICLE